MNKCVFRVEYEEGFVPVCTLLTGIQREMFLVCCFNGSDRNMRRLCMREQARGKRLEYK